MAFACRICKEKFNLSRLLLTEKTGGSPEALVSTQCGHLFHSKCLEGALTNQKLLHMRHGTGPLRRFCPVAKCNADIKSEDSIISISLHLEEETTFEDDSTSSNDDSQSQDVKLVKRVQALTAERDKLLEDIQRVDTEAELLRSVFEEIRYDLAEIQSFLNDDRLLKKGDLIFWVTKEGTYAPGKVLEIRKKPGETNHFAIVKLERKTMVLSTGSNATTRDTLILPVSELVTYKSFFCDFFSRFQAKFESFMIDLNWEIQELISPTGPSSSSASDRNMSNYYRSTRKLSRPQSAQSKSNLVLEGLESSSVSVECIPVAAARPRRHSQPLPQTQSPLGMGMGLQPQLQRDEGKSTKITRSSTIHYGEGNRPRRLEKCRSKSWANPQTRILLDSPNESQEIELENLELELRNLEQISATFELPNDDEEEEEDDSAPKEFIRVGEDVIWFDSYSEYEQIGTVAAVCEYSPCAIVHFEEHPFVKHKFQYRTVPLDELFPYDLASTEDKLRIAGIYGKMIDFVESRQHIFTMPNDDATTSTSTLSDCEDVNINPQREMMMVNADENEVDC